MYSQVTLYAVRGPGDSYFIEGKELTVIRKDSGRICGMLIYVGKSMLVMEDREADRVIEIAFGDIENISLYNINQ